MALLFLCVSLLFSLEESILYLTGASDLSEVGEERAEHYRSLADHPLNVNFVSAGALSSSGLFSSYQIASIEDYRVRCGDILSPTELGAVDGFNPELAAYLAVFLDFTATGTGREAYLSARAGPLHFEASGGFGAKASDGKGYLRWMGKAAAQYAGFSASVAARPEWSLPLKAPGDVGWSASYSGHRFNAIVGRYHARFGQGMLLWSGTDFTSFTTPQALMKKPAGLTAYTSFALDGTMYGAAARIFIGKLSISPFADSRTRSAGGNIAWNHRNGQFGATALYSGRRLMLSADFQHTFSGVTLYGEVTSLRSGVVGARFTMGRIDAGVRALYSPDEHSVAAAASYLSDNRIHAAGLSGSVAYGDGAGQIRSQATYSATPDSTWNFGLRATLRLKPSYAKCELRADCGWHPRGTWNISVRTHILHCVEWAGLAAIEAGFTPSRVGLYIQTGVFRIDNWNDRIYVYRRDAPGNYNVPAMYGRGWWAAQYAMIRLGGAKGETRSWGRVYLRSEFTAYPWARTSDTRKRPSAGAAVQITVNLDYFRKTKNTAATRQPKATM